MTEIEGFGESARDLVDDLINRPFPNAIPVLERWFDGLTRNQLIFFEQYWREHGPSTSEREIWEALKRTNERQKVAKRPSVGREVVRIFGKKIVVYRDTRTGRWTRKPRRTR